MTRADSHQLLLELVSNLPITTGRLNDDGILMEMYGEPVLKYGFAEAYPLGECFLEHFKEYAPQLRTALEGGHSHFEIRHFRDDGKVVYAEACFAFNESRGKGAIFFCGTSRNGGSLKYG